ncbi:hypothetical protein INT45_004004 [Circinella minor]|uniref:Uncharacterized protein n=1 Tax=Circinella minor TaxID=1195481 RepID=A0A8H7RYR4_9FUNG|nr:hypothetical protein INT45_004004 [Circinella minor]
MNNRQADFSAVPPANSGEAPWQHHREPDHGVEDPWNHSPDARMHPELHNSAYGTVTTEDEKKEELEHQHTPITTKKNNNDHQQKERKKSHNNKHYNEGSSSPPTGCFGHTVESKRSPQAFVKRDLNNI